MNNKRIIANNKKAFHDYFIDERFEAGIELKGTEVKSLRNGRASLKEAYIDIRNGEAFIYQMNIPPYEQGNIYNVDSVRNRKLLLHKKEINKLFNQKQRQGYTIIPLSLYFNNGKVKLELALAKGKKIYDKRKAIAEKETKRRIERNLRY